jgi:integrase
MPCWGPATGRLHLRLNCYFHHSNRRSTPRCPLGRLSHIAPRAIHTLSHLMGGGIDVVKIGERLGHSSATMTPKILHTVSGKGMIRRRRYQWRRSFQPSPVAIWWQCSHLY